LIFADLRRRANGAIPGPEGEKPGFDDRFPHGRAEIFPLSHEQDLESAQDHSFAIERHVDVLQSHVRCRLLHARVTCGVRDPGDPGEDDCLVFLSLSSQHSGFSDSC
jgi:hypothetical protein